MKKRLLIGLVLMLFTLHSCIEETDTDLEKPKIELISPSPCDTLNFGQTFLFKMKITDNTGMGNVSMDLHHNFQHHNHGEHETCNMDETKEADNPYYNDWLFYLPEAEKEYILDTLIFLEDTSNFDVGDYHFHMYVTDDEGYQTFTTLDVKVL